MVFGVRAACCAKGSCFSKIAVELPKLLQRIQKVASCCFEVLKKFVSWSLAYCFRSVPSQSKNVNTLQKIPSQVTKPKADSSAAIPSSFEKKNDSSVNLSGEFIGKSEEIAELSIESEEEPLSSSSELETVDSEEKDSSSSISEDSPVLSEKTESEPEDSVSLSPKKSLAGSVESSEEEKPQSTWVRLPPSGTVFSFLYPSANSQPWLVLNPIKTVLLKTEEPGSLVEEERAEASVLTESEKRETLVPCSEISLEPESLLVKKDLTALPKEDDASTQEVKFFFSSSLLLPPEPTKTEKGLEGPRCMNVPSSKNFLASPSSRAQPWV